MKNVMTRQDATKIIVDAKRQYAEIGKRVKGITAAIRNCNERLDFLSNYCFDEDDRVPGLLADATKKDLDNFLGSLENEK